MFLSQEGAGRMRTVPGSRQSVTAAWRELEGWAYWALGDYPRLARRIRRKHGLVVSSGPFAGLRYHKIWGPDRVTTKLLGSYEAELHERYGELIARGFSTVVNVGAGEGYYAVGLARALPGARVVAFEMKEDMRRFCSDLARHNGVEGRLEIRGWCDRAALASCDLEGALVVVDCEGFENELLDGDLIPLLGTAFLVVEAHDFASPGVSWALQERFSSSHAAAFVEQRARDPRDYPVLEGLGDAERHAALSEERLVDGRPADLRWVFLYPRSAPSGGPDVFPTHDRESEIPTGP